MSEPKKKRTAGDVIRRLIMLIALVVFCYSAYQLISIYLEYKAGTDEYEALEQYAGGLEEAEVLEEEIQVSRDGEQVMKNPVDFEGLKQINDEIIGWLKVKALDLNYPITQGKDNDFYLHNTFEKEPNIAGCIFLECQNKKDFSDKNSVIYGHNMKNGSMFGTLKRFYEDGVYDKSPYIWIYTPDKIYKYEIFSCQEVGAASDTYQLTFESNEQFMEYIDRAFEQSVVQSNVTVEPEDTIITLSTCTANQATRFVVQAKRIETFLSE